MSAIDSAFPIKGFCVDASGALCGEVVHGAGLSKRELFALAMTAALVLRAIPGEGVGFAPFNPLEKDQRHHFIEVGLMMADDILAALKEEPI